MLSLVLFRTGVLVAHASRRLCAWLIFDVGQKTMLNLAGTFALLSFVVAALAGLAATIERGFLAVVFGIGIGAAIGFGFACGVFALEASSNPQKGKRFVIPFALTSLLALAAPMVAGFAAWLASERLAQFISP